VLLMCGCCVCWWSVGGVVWGVCGVVVCGLCWGGGGCGVGVGGGWWGGVWTCVAWGSGSGGGKGWAGVVGVGVVQQCLNMIVTLSSS